MPRSRVNGVSLYYELEGRGEPVALLNGVLMTTASWTPMRQQLVPHLRCLLHDLRGQMLSPVDVEPSPRGVPAGQASGGSWSMQQHADDLVALLDELGIASCHLIGTSYGGEVGLLLAAAYPERTRSLSLIASVADVGPDLAHGVDSWVAASLRGPEALMQAVAADSYSQAFLDANPELIEQGARRIAAQPETFLAGFRCLVEAFKRLDARPVLGSITAPCLVVAAERDAIKPPEACLRAARAIPHCEAVVIPDAGHAVVIEQPGTVASVVLGFVLKHSQQHRHHDQTTAAASDASRTGSGNGMPGQSVARRDHGSPDLVAEQGELRR